MLRKLFE
jgi:class 3 adenylate cyclase